MKPKMLAILPWTSHISTTLPIRLKQWPIKLLLLLLSYMISFQDPLNRIQQACMVSLEKRVTAFQPDIC